MESTLLQILIKKHLNHTWKLRVKHWSLPPKILVVHFFLGWFETKEYIGSTGVSFKTRCNQHKSSFKSNKFTQTTLSAYIKEKKNQTNINYSFMFKTTCKNPPTNQKCVLYATRIAVAESDRERSLHQRAELVALCPHFKLCFY